MKGKCGICKTNDALAPRFGSFNRKVIVGSDQLPVIMKCSFYTEEGEEMPLCDEHLQLIVALAFTQKPLDLHNL